MNGPPAVKAWVGVPLLLAIVWSPGAARAVCTPSPLGRDAPTAVILSGGGAKGAYEAGAVALFAERGLSIQLVAGSSAGALNATMVAAGRADHLETMWRGLRREHVYSHRASVFFAGLLPGWLTLLALDGATALLDPQPLRELSVEALPLEVPEHIDLDVSGMEIGGTLRIADVEVPEGVTFLDDPETVVATVTAPSREVAPEEELEGEEAEALEGETPGETPEGGAEAPAEPEADAAGDQGTVEG